MSHNRTRKAKLHWRNRKANHGVKPAHGGKKRALKAARRIKLSRG